jgi:prevent-host-death family protein
MKQVNIHYAKTHLSRLLEEVAAGEEIIIAKAGKPYGRLVAINGVPVKKKSAWEISESLNFKGRILPGFDDPLTEDDLFDYLGGKLQQ